MFGWGLPSDTDGCRRDDYGNRGVKTLGAGHQGAVLCDLTADIPRIIDSDNIVAVNSVWGKVCVGEAQNVRVELVVKDLCESRATLPGRGGGCGSGFVVTIYGATILRGAVEIAPITIRICCVSLVTNHAATTADLVSA